MNLHSLELPTAQLCCITANLNRDVKKQKKPYTIEDFCYFTDQEESGPERQAAIAYWTLVERKKIPSWALFCLNDFKAGKGKTYATDPAFVSDHLLLLAPRETERGLKGVMIAEAPASGQQVVGEWEGHRMVVSVPKFDGFVVALADAELVVLRQLAEGMQP